MRDSLEQAGELAGADVLGRIPNRRQVAVIDIGSNSVRLVVYEGHTRAPAPVFNEKVLSGLGRQVATTGRLDDEAVDSALAGLRRFKLLCGHMDVAQINVLATAAVREAENGPAFAEEAESILGTPIEILSGAREAELTAHGVAAGIERPDGICADLGGGSLELIDVADQQVGTGITLPLGGLRLSDLAEGSMKRAEKLVAEALDGAGLLEQGKDRGFYAIGGTFRSLARLHMAQSNYPLHVIHNYAMTPDEALDFARIVRRVDVTTLDSIDQVSTARRELLPYGAMVLEHLIQRQQPSSVILSSLGVREGFLHEQLDMEARNRDPLVDGAAELSQLRSRSPRHAVELCAWTDRFMASTGLDETAAERRLRHVACLLADIGWRAHPDYRGEQSLNIILHANFTGVDHPGRAYLGMAVYLRHTGLNDAHPPAIRELMSARMLDRARILAGAMRVAYTTTGAMPGVMPHTPLIADDDTVVLKLPRRLTALDGERIRKRLRQLARLIGREAVTEIIDD